MTVLWVLACLALIPFAWVGLQVLIIRPFFWVADWLFGRVVYPRLSHEKKKAIDYEVWRRQRK